MTCIQKPTYLLHRVDLQPRQSELEIWPQVLVDINAGSRRNCHGRDSWFMQIHEEGDKAGGQVQQGALAEQRRALEHLQLHARQARSQVSDH